MYQAPSAESISQDMRASVNAEIPTADSFIWPNNLYVATKVFAQALRALFLRLGWVHRQAFVATADGEILDLHATNQGTARLAATLAAGGATASGDDGTIIPAATRLTRTDGVVYQVVADATIAGGTVAVQVVAEDTGKAGNAVPGTPIPPETPIAGVVSIVVDASGISGGTDDESDASLRSRLLDLKRNPSHGGSPSEYIRWVREGKVGITRCFIQRATPDAGHVTIIPMMDETYDDGLPTDDDLADIVAVLEENAPSSASLHVLRPTLVTVDVQISSLDPSTDAVKAQIEGELNAAFRRLSEPGTATEDAVFFRSWIDEAISNASGETSHTLVLPASDQMAGVDSAGNPELLTLGTVSFT